MAIFAHLRWLSQERWDVGIKILECYTPLIDVNNAKSRCFKSFELQIYIKLYFNYFKFTWLARGINAVPLRLHVQVQNLALEAKCVFNDVHKVKDAAAGEYLVNNFSITTEDYLLCGE